MKQLFTTNQNLTNIINDYLHLVVTKFHFIKSVKSLDIYSGPRRRSKYERRRREIFDQTSYSLNFCLTDVFVKLFDSVRGSGLF